MAWRGLREQDIEEQESLELLRKWREEEKERKEKEIAAKAETEAREGKKSAIEIADQRSTSPSSSVEASGVSTMTLDERAQGRGDGFHSILRVSSETSAKTTPATDKASSLPLACACSPFPPARLVRISVVEASR